MNNKTIAQHFGEERLEHKGAVVTPIYQNSLFTFKSWDAIDEAFEDPQNNYIYTRGNNPSVVGCEKKIAKLAGGEKAKLCASGMGAISSAIMNSVKTGDHIIAVKNTYGPASNLMGQYLKKRWNVEVTFVEGKELTDFSNNIQDNTTLIYLESPSSVVMSLQDIRGVAKLAKEHKIRTIIDNTMATFLYQKPLEMGIDIEVHSCSKYIGGHSDVVAGVIISSAEIIDSIFTDEAALFGAKMAPFEASLIQRSLRTFEIRVREHSKNTEKFVEYLESEPLVTKIYSPCAKDYDQAELRDQQMSGVTGLLAFEMNVDDVDKLKLFVNSFEYFSIGVSWGGHESLIYPPAISYLKEYSPEDFKMLGITLGTIRMSIGLEDVEDLIADTKKCFDLIR